MQLIQKIEINYLRSLYSSIIDGVGDLNIIFGRNDSGKSNLLRALNLFFNNETEPGRLLEFDLDMSDRRKQEAREAKGKQFIWIKITFNIPRNYQNSLGEQLTIKRQWNRDGGMTETVFPEIEGGGARARLTRLINEIDFSYIPAIKDLNVYADLIERMYGAAAETVALHEAITRFVDAIEGQTTALSEQLSTLFGAPARLAPPTEMSRLFRNLDFAHGEDGHSLLRQKGDGIKARHLPELLRFINENETRKKFYIWGFEEPENSLDLSAAEAEAKRFATFASSGDTQVFITSHSPAFYLSNSEDANIRRFFITKQEKGAGDQMEPRNAAALIDRVEDAESRMEQAGLLQLPFVIRMMRDQRAVLEKKAGEAEALRTQLAKLNQPALFVEGKHDVALFERALNRIGAQGKLTIKALGGTPQTTDALLSAVLEQGGINASAPTMFLFDDDKAGRAAFRKLCTNSPQPEPTLYGAKTLIWTLPRTDEFKKFLRRNTILIDQAFFTSEFLYPIEDSAKLCLDLIKNNRSDDILKWEKTINGDYWPGLGQEKCNKLSSAEEGSADWLYARGIPNELKKLFNKKAVEQEISTEYIDYVADIVATRILSL
ncbi:MAG: ATP-binding protein [Bosea sp.]|uniref:ATP-dependent nuclease n=1 Tax=Bosea sp. (in: a-proteobacteria) TaxID=1871050 RepID=UPI00238D69D1|nr:ATP-binding protein [Bosea sp. (in: a-proteobacteria)]MCP4738700.1 ATP-binding protein [Bosea sp. (in: a-proteobacteria)]